MNGLLGVDYGHRRLGLAAGDAAGIVATALRTVPVRSVDDAVAAVVAACAETEAEGVVIGLPLNMNGTRGPMARQVEAFAERLRGRLDIPVELWDERLSSSLVERTLLDADLSRRKRKAVRDKLAAQVILQSFLDARAQPGMGGEGEVWA